MAKTESTKAQAVHARINIGVSENDREAVAGDLSRGACGKSAGEDDIGLMRS